MAISAIKIDEGALNISTLFSAEGYNKLFKVRPPQRRYKWDKNEVTQLWSDILNAHNKKQSKYFLGTLLLVAPDNTEGEVLVIDGQQRIATLSILLAVLRDCCRDIAGLHGRADGLQRLIARVDNDGEPIGSLVVTLQDPDNDKYISSVKDLDSTTSLPSPKSAPADRVFPAVRIMSNLVNSYINNEPDTEKTLHDLCEYVQTKVELLPLEVASEGQSYLVFDTTNTRGLRLSPAEALKARLATIAREDTALSGDLINKWNKAAIELERAGLRIDAMDDYLHAIWSSKQGYTAKRSLDKIKVDGEAGLIALVNDIDSYSSDYLAIVSPSGNARLSQDLRDLKHLNVQANSFLTMVHRHAHTRFDEAVQLTLSLQIRNITIGTKRPNSYEKDWPNWAKLVREGHAGQALGEIRDRMVSDIEFIKSFNEATIKSTATAKHLLRRLDPISNSESGVLPYEVDLEHIFPKSVVDKLLKKKNLTKNTRTWIEDMGRSVQEAVVDSQSLGQEMALYLNMLGNQALLNLHRNRRGRDKPFADKKAYYKNQALELTKDLANLPQWDIGEIKKRQEKLAALAPKIWVK